jgi:single-stranded DNA-binding protein
MPSNASVTLIGHIGEPKFTQTGEHLTARFGLATTRKRKESEVTTWWNVTCWRKDADFVQKYVKKGQLLMIEGDAYEEEYEGKKYLKVEARRVMNLSPKEAEPAAMARQPSAIGGGKAASTGPSDLEPPFTSLGFWG